MPFPRSQIQFRRLSAVQMLEPQHMRLGQITHMNVVANAGAVRRWIIVTINLQYTAFAVERLERCRNQVRFRIADFGNLSTFTSAASVEISKAHQTHSVSALVDIN